MSSIQTENILFYRFVYIVLLLSRKNSNYVVWSVIKKQLRLIGYCDDGIPGFAVHWDWWTIEVVQRMTPSQKSSSALNKALPCSIAHLNHRMDKYIMLQGIFLFVEYLYSSEMLVFNTPTAMQACAIWCGRILSTSSSGKCLYTMSHLTVNF